MLSDMNNQDFEELNPRDTVDLTWIKTASIIFTSACSVLAHQRS